MQPVQCKLLTKTRELLNQRPRTLTYQKINDDTGLPVSWLMDFNASADRDHGAARVVALYEYLTGSKLL